MLNQEKKLLELISEEKIVNYDDKYFMSFGNWSGSQLIVQPSLTPTGFAVYDRESFVCQVNRWRDWILNDNKKESSILCRQKSK